MTYTYCVMHVKPETYEEIAKLLRDAGWHQAFHEDRDDGIVLDMHGIALAMSPCEQRGAALLCVERRGDERCIRDYGHDGECQFPQALPFAEPEPEPELGI